MKSKITTDAFCIVNTQAKDLFNSKCAIDLNLRSLYNEEFIIFISQFCSLQSNKTIHKLKITKKYLNNTCNSTKQTYDDI